MRNCYKKLQPFYMVYAEGGNTPACKHETLESAEGEADRLSNKLGVNCYVLTATEKYEPQDIEVELNFTKGLYWFRVSEEIRVNEALEAKMEEIIGKVFWDDLGENAWSKGYIMFNDDDNQLQMWKESSEGAKLVKVMGTEIRIKEE